MKLKINKLEWKIKVSSQEDLKKTGDFPDNHIIFGMCDRIRFDVHIWDKCDIQALKTTVIHELVHAYTTSYNQILTIECDYAEFFAMFHVDILRDAEKVLKWVTPKLKKEVK